MHNFHYSFNLDPLKTLNKDFINRFKEETYFERLWDGDMFRVIDKNFLNYLNTHLPVQNIVCFYKIKDSGVAKNPQWHLDHINDLKNNSGFGLNIVPKIENGTSLMEWGKFKNIEFVKELTMKTNDPLTYEDTLVNSLYKANLDNAVSLVNLKYPHRVIVGSERRFCASIRFHTNVKNWYKILDYFFGLDWPDEFVR